MTKTLDDMKMVHEEEMQNYDRMQETVTRVMHRHGCKIIQTPAFEEYDTYSRLFPQLKREMVKTIDTDGQVLVMRPDVTVPLVRTVDREYLDSDICLRFFANFSKNPRMGSTSHRAGGSAGDSTAECDGEVIVLALEFLKSVGITDVRIDLGNVSYMHALFGSLGLRDEELALVNRKR